MLDARLVRRGEGETIFDTRERTIRILADRPELTLTWFRYEPGEEGPDPHVHQRHTDAFYVLEGELELGLGPEVQRFSAAPGTLAAAPPSVAHTFRNASDARAVFLNIHAPSMGFADMLRASREGKSEKAARFDQFEPPADGGRALSDAVFRGPGKGEAITFGQGSAVLKAEGSDADGFFSLTETDLGHGFPAIPHRHEALVDSLYVLHGTLRLQLGNEEVEAQPGDFALVPPGTVHAVANPTGASVRMLNLMAPGGFEQYLKDVAVAASPGSPNPEFMAELASRYDFVPA